MSEVQLLELRLHLFTAPAGRIPRISNQIVGFDKTPLTLQRSYTAEPIHMGMNRFRKPH